MPSTSITEGYYSIVGGCGYDEFLRAFLIPVNGREGTVAASLILLRGEATIEVQVDITTLRRTDSSTRFHFEGAAWTEEQESWRVSGEYNARYGQGNIKFLEPVPEPVSSNDPEGQEDGWTEFGRKPDSPPDTIFEGE